MRIFENADKIALGQALAIAAKQFPRNGAHVAGAGPATVLGDVLHGTTHEFERLVTREAHPAGADAVARLVSRLLYLSGRASSNRLRSGRSCAVFSMVR